MGKRAFHVCSLITSPLLSFMNSKINRKKIALQDLLEIIICFSEEIKKQILVRYFDITIASLQTVAHMKNIPELFPG
jgi:hypothetical protein